MSRLVLTTVFILSLIHVYFLYGELPENLATRFGFDGHPQTWSSRRTLIILQSSMMAMMYLMFLGMGVWMQKAKDRHINLVYKAYWLEPTRREQTIYFLRTRFEYLGAVTLFFLAFTFEMIRQANSHDPVQMPFSFLYFVGIYVAGVIGWSFYYVRRFYKVPPHIKETVQKYSKKSPRGSLE